MLYVWLVLGLVSAQLPSPLRWSTPYPDGRTQDLLAVVSPSEFYMASRVMGGINHYSSGVWSIIPNPPAPNPSARCLVSRSATQLLVVLEGSPVAVHEYNVAAGRWVQQTNLDFAQVGGNFACTFASALFIIADNRGASIWDVPVYTSRNQTNLCSPTCTFVAGSQSTVMYTFTSNQGALLRYGGSNWAVVNPAVNVNLTSPIEAFASAPDGTLYVAALGKLSKSIDGGLTWQRVASVACASGPTPECHSTGIYATNTLVVFGNSDVAVQVYNATSGNVTTRSAPARVILAGGSGNTAVLTGPFGSAWTTTMVQGASPQFVTRTGGVIADHQKHTFLESDFLLCQVHTISGYQSSVFALTSGCPNPNNFLLAAPIPAARNWTRIGSPLSLSSEPFAMHVNPANGDIWVITHSDTVDGEFFSYHNGTWQMEAAYSNTYTAIHGNNGHVIVVFFPASTYLLISSSPTYTFTPRCDPFVVFNPNGFPAAAYIVNASLYLIADAVVHITTNGGSSWSTINNNIDPTVAYTALHYRPSANMWLAASDRGLWQSIGTAGWTRAMSPTGPLTQGFTHFWARNDNDTWASGDTQDVLWHYTTGPNWTSFPVPTNHLDSWFPGAATWGVRGMWGGADGALYVGSRAGVLGAPITTLSPTRVPTKGPTVSPTRPTKMPTTPTKFPTFSPTKSPTTTSPTLSPSTKNPTNKPSKMPTPRPTFKPSKSPHTQGPSQSPTKRPTKRPTPQPTGGPTEGPSIAPTKRPTRQPTSVACVCLNDCTYRGIPLHNNGVCEDDGPDGRVPALAACLRGHDCADCGPSVRNRFKDPEYCGGPPRQDSTISAAFPVQVFAVYPIILLSMCFV